MDMHRWDHNRSLTTLAAASLVAVSAYWAWQLATPRDDPGAARVQLAGARARAMDPAQAAPLVSLLSPGSVATRVEVQGVLAGGRTPLALLSVDGAPVQAYTAGQRLGPATRVTAIAAETVMLEQAGQPRALSVPVLPPLPTQGLARVAAPAR